LGLTLAAASVVGAYLVISPIDPVIYCIVTRMMALRYD
jgi:hypothetical protein